MNPFRSKFISRRLQEIAPRFHAGDSAARIEMNLRPAVPANQPFKQPAKAKKSR